MINIALPSVQSLLIEMFFNGSPISTGTGFVVNSTKGPALITNRHNVTGKHQITGALLSKTGGIPNEISIVHNQEGRLGSWVVRKEQLLDGDGNPLWKEHPRLKDQADFVAILLKSTDDIEFYPYDVSNSGPDLLLGPADTVSVVGFPFGIQAGGSLAVWATGFIASEPEVNFDNKPIFLVDCRSRPGQSGSAVIAYRNGGAVAVKGGTSIFGGPVTKFLGIYSGRINNESDLGIVWKASSIMELVGSI